jgi:tetratricopeptide (TPR) repeat protein
MPLSHDLKRMAPVWGIVVLTALVVVFGMRYISLNFLENALTANQSGCDYAALYVAAGRKKMEGIRIEQASLRSQQPDLKTPSLGIMKGDESLVPAKADFQRALELCAVNAEPHRYLATLEWYEGNASAAYYHLAELQRTEEGAEAAVDSLMMALDEDPDNEAALRALALTYRELGRLQDAVALVEGREEQMRHTPEGEIALGRIYLSAGRFDDAEKLLREGLQENPSDVPAMKDLHALFVRRSAQEEGAEFFLSLGSEERPTVGDAAHLAASLYRSVGNLEMEEKSLRRVLDYFPNNVSIMFDLARNLHEQKKMNAAADMLTAALEKNPTITMKRIEEAGFRPGE